MGCSPSKPIIKSANKSKIDEKINTSLHQHSSSSDVLLVERKKVSFLKPVLSLRSKLFPNLTTPADQIDKITAPLTDDIFIKEILRCFPFLQDDDQFKDHYLQSMSIEDDRNKSINRNYANAMSLVQGNKSINLPANHDSNTTGANSVFSMMIVKSLETVMPVAVPLELWLRERLANWVQLSGHKGNVVPATDSTIWKKVCDSKDCLKETDAYRLLSIDSCQPFVPKFFREVVYNGETFIELEDLTGHFTNPAVMDIKMGSRTFLESEVENPKTRHDLYLKMVQVDPLEPSKREIDEQAITKLRYMQFRENESSTSSLGFRIEGVKDRNSGQTSKDFKQLRERSKIMETFRKFLSESYRCCQMLATLRNLRQSVEKSQFFRSHELIGSSLLILYDNEKLGVWMIDFAKASNITLSIYCNNNNNNDVKTLDHRSQWTLGNHEDGYLFGLDNLIKIFEDLTEK